MYMNMCVCLVCVCLFVSVVCVFVGAWVYLWSHGSLCVLMCVCTCGLLFNSILQSWKRLQLLQYQNRKYTLTVIELKKLSVIHHICDVKTILEYRKVTDYMNSIHGIGHP